MIWPLSYLWNSGESTAGKTAQAVSEAVQDAAPKSTAPFELLQHFQNPCVSLPPSARVGDTKLKRAEAKPMSIWQLGRLGVLAAVKATEILTDVVSYELWGPRRKSWGLEMTLLSCIMRDIGRHSYLGDMSLIRLLMSIGGYIPLPSDALVTPVTFHVSKRNLRGLLAEYDAAEDGTRELSGEWVVGKYTWQRLQREWQAKRAMSKDGGSNFGSSNEGAPSTKRERVVLYLHGGAYYVSSAASHRLTTIPIAKYLDARIFALDYRLAPETNFPGPLHDAVAAYMRLVEDLRIPPENIIIAGDSAGGGLSLALMMYLRDNDYPLPSAAILMSPWVDLTMSCDSWDSNAQYDIVPRPIPGDHLNPIACYLGDNLEQYVTHPYASPLFGDLKGLPPMLIQAGECEVLRDEITLLAHKSTLAGVEVKHELYEDMVHVFQTLPFLDAAQRAFMSARDFVHNFLPQLETLTPRPLAKNIEERLEAEIDNDSARVVSGDGMETQRRQCAETTEERHRHISEQLAEDKPEADRGVFSWASQWTPPLSDEENDEVPSMPHTPMAPLSPSQPQRPRVQSRPSIQRIKSTISFIADASYRSASDQLELTKLNERERQQERERGGSAATALMTPVASVSARRYRGSTISISAIKSTVPRPSIRRSDVSHPNIRSLVRQYERAGPENETLTYHQEQKSGKRARARTITH